MAENTARILIVDDIPENLYIVENVLQSRDYETISASSGAEALVEIERQSFDLVLLDVLMPDMDGFEVCARLKRMERTRDIPVIFLTALNDDDNILNGFEVGGVDYVAKPFRPAELLARVDTHLTLRRRELELASINASKDKFISIIANELRQPFAALRGVLSMMDEEYDTMDDEDRREYLSISYHNADNLYRLASGLMTWSSLKRGVLPFRPVAMDLVAAVEDALDPLRERMQAKQLKLVMEELPAADVQADRDMLQDILDVLLTNAVMYNVEQGEVRIGLREVEDFWEVSITDTGIGIDEEDQKSLFRIDEDLRSRGTHGESGTGMGLILARELVEKHAGTITLQSAGGETCVRFTVPSLPG